MAKVSIPDSMQSLRMSTLRWSVMEDVLSMVSGKDKFTVPKMPMRLGNFYRIDIQLKSYFNEKIAGDVTMQMTIENLL